MADPKTETKNGVNVNAAGSYADELRPQAIEDGLGPGAATGPIQEGSLGEKEAPDTTGTNPKRTENSRPD